MRGTTRQLWLLRSWRWQTTLNCEMPSLPDTLWVQLTGFVCMTWCITSESTVLRLPDIGRGSCTPSKISWAICSHKCNHMPLHLSHNKYFCCFCCVMAKLEFVKYKVPNLYVHLSGFEITHRGKQCTTGRRTNYRYTDNPSRYLPRLELLQSHDMPTTNWNEPKYCKTFDSSLYFYVKQWELIKQISFIWPCTKLK